MVSHDNMIFQGTTLNYDFYHGATEEFREEHDIADNKIVSFLPLSHVAAMMSDLISSLLSGS